MLEENSNIQQISGELPRRWFSDEFFDLIIWEKKPGNYNSFQLCYNKQSDEHALTWRKEHSVEHFRVDSGEPGPLKNLSPMMIDDGVVDLNRLIRKFEEKSRKIEPQIRDFILRKLEEYQRTGI